MTSSTTNTQATQTKTEKKNPIQHFLAGGCAGVVESTVCHPRKYDTLNSNSNPSSNTLAFLPSSLSLSYALVCILS